MFVVSALQFTTQACSIDPRFEPVVGCCVCLLQFRHQQPSQPSWSIDHTSTDLLLSPLLPDWLLCCHCPAARLHNELIVVFSSCCLVDSNQKFLWMCFGVGYLYPLHRNRPTLESCGSRHGRNGVVIFSRTLPELAWSMATQNRTVDFGIDGAWHYLLFMFTYLVRR